jgi:hypothetical protein
MAKITIQDEEATFPKEKVLKYYGVGPQCDWDKENKAIKRCEDCQANYCQVNFHENSSQKIFRTNKFHLKNSQKHFFSPPHTSEHFFLQQILFKISPRVETFFLSWVSRRNFFSPYFRYATMSCTDTRVNARIDEFP